MCDVLKTWTGLLLCHYIPCNAKLPLDYIFTIYLSKNTQYSLLVHRSDFLCNKNARYSS